MLLLTLFNLAVLQVPDADLVSVPAGEFTMGRALSAHDDEKPAHRVRISAFSMQRTLVTVGDFKKFVARTGAKTTAETLGYAMVATEGLGEWEWKRVPGASWRAPFGPGGVADFEPRDDLPVTTVSWLDADAYCRSVAMRLPTEAEWEYAMRAGATTRFPWGDSPLLADGGVGLNFWQGDHHENQRLDGYVYLSPVKAFGPNAFGLYDPVGNVWQWVADWYAADAYAQAGAVAVNPTGPKHGTQRVTRGGSWWCSKKTCTGYGLFARGKALPNAPFNNNGFRCVKDGSVR